MKHFTTVHDLKDPLEFIHEAILFKGSGRITPFAGKTIGLVFMNPSLRTRMSTQRAAMELGMQVIVLNAERDSWNIEWEDKAVMNGNSTEHIREFAGMLNLYCDMIAIRCFASLTNKEKDYAEFMLIQLMKYATVPVISLESATLHPLQSLADMMTIIENRSAGKKPKVVLSWAPHVKALPQAVANSFCEWMSFMDAEFIITNPPGYDLSPEFVKNVPIFHSQEDALAEADFIYVKNWSSFSDYGKMPDVEGDWLLSKEKSQGAHRAKIMHCLPVRRNVELPDELLLPDRSLILQQAENRLHAAKFVIHQLAKSNFEIRDQSHSNKLIYG